MSKKSARTERRYRRNEKNRILSLIKGNDNLVDSNIPKLVVNPVNVDIHMTQEDPDIFDKTIVNLNSEALADPLPSLSLTDSIRVWASQHYISHMAIKDLLSILNPHVNNILPADSRTLMKTPRVINVQKLSGGEFVYFGILAGVVKRMSKNYTSCTFPIISKFENECQNKVVSISVGIDGLPISRSSKKEFWPIIGLVDQIENCYPFIIGLFYGTSKPTDTEFLREFVNESLKLQQTGLIVGISKFNFKISCIIADAPARSFIKGCKQHNSYDSCERCVQEGEWLGRVIFREINCPLRTDASFLAKNDPDHHKSDTELIKLKLGPVSQVVLDHMHLVFLGVTRKVLRYWVKGKLPHRLCSREVLFISQNLQRLRPFITRDFQRKPRPLSELDHFKATEFRLILLYVGISAFHDSIPLEKFKHFLKLQSAMFILLSPNASIVSWNHLAKSLLVQFVQEAEIIYGLEFMVYNVHSLIHLSDDALLFGNLANISAFPFENFMQTIKRMLHSNNFHLSQVAKRLAEKEAMTVEIDQHVKTKRNEFTKSKYDNIYCLNDGRYVILKSYVNEFISDFYKVEVIGKLPDYPFNSLSIGIFLANVSKHVISVNITDICHKCMFLPYGKSFLCVPLLHTMK